MTARVHEAIEIRQRCEWLTGADGAALWARFLDLFFSLPLDEQHAVIDVTREVNQTRREVAL